MAAIEETPDVETELVESSAVQEVPNHDNQKDVEDKPDGDETEKDETVGDEESKVGANSDCYLNREEYSSKRFKLEIKNLPKSFGFGVRLAVRLFLALKLL